MIAILIGCYAIGVFVLTVAATTYWMMGDKEDGAKILRVALIWPIYLISTIIQMFNYDSKEGTKE